MIGVVNPWKNFVELASGSLNVADFVNTKTFSRNVLEDSELLEDRSDKVRAVLRYAEAPMYSWRPTLGQNVVLFVLPHEFYSTGWICQKENKVILTHLKSALLKSTTCFMTLAA